MVKLGPPNPTYGHMPFGFGWRRAVTGPAGLCDERLAITAAVLDYKLNDAAAGGSRHIVEGHRNLAGVVRWGQR